MLISVSILILMASIFFLSLHALWTDVRSMIIENWTCVAIFSLALVRFVVAPDTFYWWDFALFSGFLIIGIFISNANFIGAGDIKLLSALILWFGISHTEHMILGLGLIILAITIPFILARQYNLLIFAEPYIKKIIPSFDAESPPIPYAIGIVPGAIYALYEQFVTFSKLGVITYA